jgi:hypothetical protein
VSASAPEFSGRRATESSSPHVLGTGPTIRPRGLLPQVFPSRSTSTAAERCVNPAASVAKLWPILLALQVTDSHCERD